MADSLGVKLNPTTLAFAPTARRSTPSTRRRRRRAVHNGPPGVRSDYHPHYYAAFILDPEGNNVEVVCQADPNARPGAATAAPKVVAKAKEGEGESQSQAEGQGRRESEGQAEGRGQGQAEGESQAEGQGGGEEAGRPQGKAALSYLTAASSASK